MHYLLVYDAAPGYMERRPEFRENHLAHAWAAYEDGSLVLAGATGDPVDGAVLLFDVDSPGPVEAFARSDPYVVNGLVSDWRVTPWHTVVGDDADHPVSPEEA